MGPGNSCIDVAQAAFFSVLKDRGLDINGKVPGQSDLIPNNWFRKLETRLKTANARTKEFSKHVKIEPKN